MTVKRIPFVLLGVALVVLLAVRPGKVQAQLESYCCLCGGCPEAACVLVPLIPGGVANVGKACPTFCPTNCERSVIVEGSCDLHTAAECPQQAPAPALSWWALVICAAALGAYGLRRVRHT
jgi:hypothetical protein